MLRKLLPVVFLFFFHSSLSQQKEDTVVYFGFSKSILNAEATAALDKILQRSSANLIDSITVFGHCDNVDSDSLNDAMSLQRAIAVKQYLIGKGVGEDALYKLKGFGKRNPVTDNLSAEHRTVNRRAEVVIYSHKPPPIQAVEAVKEAEPVEKAMAPPEPTPLVNKIEEGDKFILQNMSFYPGSDQPLPESIPVMENLAKWLENFPTVEIEIQGYICCMPEGQDGSDGFGLANLSVMRARAVYNYLVKHGINADRLDYAGYGSHPIVAEINERNRQVNRRVEILVKKK